MSLGEWLMRRVYRRAGGDPRRVVWDDPAPSSLLVDAVEAVEARAPGGRALDLGCGAGGVAVWMAQRGLDVAAVDLFEDAIAMGRARAARAGVAVEWIVGDALGPAPPGPFALVHDRGCLHSLVRGDAARYRARLLAALAPGGAFVLEHWLLASWRDHRPIGPTRRRRDALLRLFAPELRLVDERTERVWARPPHGPRLTIGRFRFVR